MMDTTDEASQDWMNQGRAQDAVMADAQAGDTLALSRYIDNAVVLDRRTTRDGVALIIKSPRGQTRYRLRAVNDDDDRLLLEKPDSEDGWTRHLRVEADRR
jgi:hypothetical protein